MHCLFLCCLPAHPTRLSHPPATAFEICSAVGNLVRCATRSTAIGAIVRLGTHEPQQMHHPRSCCHRRAHKSPVVLTQARPRPPRRPLKVQFEYWHAWSAHRTVAAPSYVCATHGCCPWHQIAPKHSLFGSDTCAIIGPVRYRPRPASPEPKSRSLRATHPVVCHAIADTQGASIECRRNSRAGA